MPGGGPGGFSGAFLAGMRSRIRWEEPVLIRTAWMRNQGKLVFLMDVNAKA